MFDPTELMQLAIDKCREGIAQGQTPFGCAIARGDRLLAVVHNTVWATTDITAHAEMNAIRQACQELDDVFLSECIVASTCEPCPMCMSALHWSRVEAVYFGASIDDAAAAGFQELQLPAADIVRLGGDKVKLVGELLRDECRALFEQWQRSENRHSY